MQVLMPKLLGSETLLAWLRLRLVTTLDGLVPTMWSCSYTISHKDVELVGYSTMVPSA